MRAANQPPSRHVDRSEQDKHSFWSTVIALLATLALLAVWHPSIVHGQEAEGRLVDAGASTAELPQDTTSAIHVVRPGDTLWQLATRYYGDGHQWPTLARQNRISLDGKTPLLVGMKLRVPSDVTARKGKAMASGTAPADSSAEPSIAHAKAVVTASPAASSTTLAAQTAGKPNADGVKGRNASVAARPSPSARQKAAPSTPAVIAASDVVTADSNRVNRAPAQPGEVMSPRPSMRIGLTDLASQEASRKASESQTVFHRDLPDAAEAERRTRAVLKPNTPAPRQAEYESAPFVLSQTDLLKGGSIGRRSGAVDNTESGHPQRVVVSDEVEVLPPTGTTYTVGQRLVVFSTPTNLDKTTVLAIPSGVVEVRRVEAGKPAMAVLTSQSGRVEQGQRLLPAVGLAAPWDIARKIATPDAQTTVRWVDPNELQPTLQSFVVLAAGAQSGVKAGDEFGLYRRGTKDRPALDVLVATARVVRSEANGSAAVITRQYQPDIGVGLTALRYARTP